MNEEFISALEEIEREKGIAKDVIFDALEAALVSSYKKNYGTNQNVEVIIDRMTGNIKLFEIKDVVADEDFEDEDYQIIVDYAKEENPLYEVGDIYRREVEPAKFGRIAAQTAKQVVIQRIRDAEREMIFEDFNARENEIITGQVQRVSYGYGNTLNVFFDLGKIEAILPQQEQIKGERYNQGSRFKLLILEVRKTTKGPQVILSRSHPNLVKRLFELEIPEISEGIVEIYSISREAGSRTKIAVFSKNENVDPLGACVGYKGSRVNAIVDELHDEKIDIVIYEEDINKFIANSLSPSKVEKVFANEVEKSALVVVPDYQLSLAIGKEGQNARLAAKLTNWKIDIKSVSQFEAYLEDNNLTEDEIVDEISKQEEEARRIASAEEAAKIAEEIAAEESVKEVEKVVEEIAEEAVEDTVEE